MIEAIVGLQQALPVKDNFILTKVEVTSEPPAQPSAVEAADFARAAASTRVIEVHAASASSVPSLVDGLSQQVDGLVARMKKLKDGPDSGHEKSDRGHETGENIGKPGLLAGRTMDDAIENMGRAYVFAVEATMASHGATEATRTFNTLLKGQ
jgi:hypothetical protein